MKIKVVLEFLPDQDIIKAVKSETSDPDILTMMALMSTMGATPRSEVISVVDDDGKVLGSHNVTEMRAKRTAEMAIRRAQQGGSK